MFFVPTRGKHVRFEQKRDVQLKRAMQLVKAAQNKEDGDHDDKVYECSVNRFSKVYEFDVGALRDARSQRKIPGGNRVRPGTGEREGLRH